MSIAAVIHIINWCTRTAAAWTTPSVFRENTDWEKTFSLPSSLHHHHPQKIKLFTFYEEILKIEMANPPFVQIK